MKVGNVLEHFLSRADWVERDKTVDRVIVGDPAADVDRCLVTWMPGMNALRSLAERGMRLLICHEPTFWNHRDDCPVESDARAREKLAFIQAHDIVILRNHDCWDLWPEAGIPWAWARFLGLGRQPAAINQDRYLHRYDVEPMTLDALARRVARQCARIGEPFVQVSGDPSQSVSRIGVGTGCGCGIRGYQEMGCDCSIVCDDGTRYWADIQRAEDFGHPVIRVNHGTSEEPGMVTLTEYINAHFEGLRAEHLPHRCMFRLTGSA
jgi:putative NIF3 family GTP cyclohydrolase 1 type 2